MRRSRRIFCVQRWDNRKILYSLCGAFILGYSLLLSEFLWLTNAPGTNSTLMDFAYHLNLRENDFFALIKEIEHLNKLHEACMRFNDSIIPWKYGINENYTEVWNKTSPQLVEYLKECPEIEILQAAHLRGHGYCQDSSVYVKFLQTRILPDWVFKMSFDIENTTSFSKAINYFDLCPNTALIILNHFDEQVPNLPDWPSRKPIYLMPNIEMYELNASSYWNVDVVLCKTLICEQRVKKWYNQEGNPRATNVFYTKHTSPDPSLHARLTLKENIIKPKNFVDLKFLHTAGTSNQKGTNKILDCWVKRPDFPPLHVYMAPEMYYQTQFAKHFPLEEKNEMSENSQQNKTKNIFFHPIMLNNTAFGQLLAEAAIVLCPSFIEGYGHYINQARAAGALVLTTNIPPMNELIQDLFSGVLIDATHGNDDSHLLGGTYKGKHGLKNVQGLRANFDGKDVCNAVEIVLDMRPDQRYQLGIQAMKQYVEDLNYFAKQMQRLREFARQQKRIY